MSGVVRRSKTRYGVAAARKGAQVLDVSSKVVVAQRTLLQRRRVQTLGFLVVALFLPWMARALYAPLNWADLYSWTAMGSLGAALAGYYIFRSLTNYPGISGGGYVLPVFFTTYAVTLAIFWLTRLDYSRIIITGGFIGCLLWSFTIFLFGQRKRTLRIGIVPYGQADSLYEIDNVDWVPLIAPAPGSRNELSAVVADFRADDMPDEWERFLADTALSGMPVYHYKQLRESMTGRVEIDHLSENSLGALVPARLYVKLKAFIDFVTATVALVLLALPMAVIALIIRLDSPGPALFRQRRTGQAGQAFRVFKFRTMHLSPPESAKSARDSAITVDNDPRITRVGRFLRRTRIDELPQIINILRGEMSWIGPRPEAEVLAQWYEAELPFYRYRHIVKPGITGWAQVNQGHVAEVDHVLWKLHYDFYYIKNFSPWLDILIVFLTLKTVLTGHGSR
jgi:lipopolysaccharide/colanic/teichoic acid biosynthesis glycosyltransferase